MPQLKYLCPVAMATTLLGICFNPASAHALALFVGTGPSTSFSGTGNTISSTQPFSAVVGGVNTTVSSFTLTQQGGQQSIASTGGLIPGLLNGAVLKLTNFNLTANGQITNSPNFVSFTHTFTNLSIANSATLTIKQFLSGRFLNNTTGARNGVTLQPTTIALGGGGAITPSGLTALTQAPTTSSTFNVGPNGGTLVTGPPVNSLTLTVRLANLTLAPNQTLNLPSSACVVVVEETEHFKLTDADAAKACGEDFAPEPATVPEPSTAISLLALGAVGIGTWLRRKREQTHITEGI